MKVTLIKGGGGDTYYELGLLSGLTLQGIHVDYIGDDHMADSQILKHKSVRFYNFRDKTKFDASLFKKLFKTMLYYFRLIKYAAITNSQLFHIQWFDKFIYFDRTFLNLYYKLLGKKLVFTAHNVDAEARESKSGFFNRLTLKILYRLVDHIIVHTTKMKEQLIEGFGIKGRKITVIKYGINDTIPITQLNRMQARAKLQLEDEDKVLLFFGNVTPYKGLEYLIHAIGRLKRDNNIVKLIIAGRIKKRESYWEKITEIVKKYDLEQQIIARLEFIPDDEIEVFFKAADVLILPYKFIFQSGPLFLSYNFGLPVIATDVGSFREDIIIGETGFICKPDHPEDLAEKINTYFNSELFRNLEEIQNEIISYAKEKYSWNKIGGETCSVYKILL